MPELSEIDAKIVNKRSTVATETPTVPASDDHTDGTWNDTDIYSGEFFINETDEKVYIRTNATIKELSTGTPTTTNKTINLSFGSDTKPYLKGKDGTYEFLASFFFEGTAIAGTPTEATIRFTNKGGITSDVRIYDVDNALVIAEVTGLSPVTEQIFQTEDMGTLSNLSTDRATWEVQLKNSATGGGKETWVSALLIT